MMMYSAFSAIFFIFVFSTIATEANQNVKKYFFYDVYGPSSFMESSVRLKRQIQDEETLLNSVDIPQETFNASLKANHKDFNGTFDHHKYYKSRMFHNDHYWVDLNKLNETSTGIVQEHSMLSKSYRHAATITLNFQFPFYGHFVRNITIATGGFLYTGEYVHSWLAATQYIAPLMANFDTSQHETAKIRYADNGTALIVEWNDVYLKAGESNIGNFSKTSAGPFTFQVIIHDNGNIIFAYKTIPIIISTIEDKVHPVKVGLSDAYIIDRTIFYVRRKTIYEYHRVNLKDALIANSSAIFFSAIPTCNIQQSCDSCLSLMGSNKDLDFECFWCQSLNRCSDGMDRYRQSWLQHNCDKFRLSNEGECQSKKTSSNAHIEMTEKSIYDNINEESNVSSSSTSSSHGSSSSIVALTIFCLLIVLAFAWAGYAYLYPHSWSGQLLIKYRPTRWHWRSSEARYTPASIHM